MVFNLVGNSSLEVKCTVIRIERLALFIGIDANLLLPVEVNEESLRSGFMGRAKKTQFGDMDKSFSTNWAFLLSADPSNHLLSLVLRDSQKILENTRVCQGFIPDIPEICSREICPFSCLFLYSLGAILLDMRIFF